MKGAPPGGLSPRAKRLLPFALLALIALSYFRIYRTESGSLGTVTLAGKTMGTTFSVLIARTRLDGTQREALQVAVHQELERLEDLMSTYRPGSELSRFNRAPEERPFPVSAETLEVASAAQVIAEQSGGAFDVTVRPLVALWGFGSGAQIEAPADEALSAARRRVDYRKLAIDQVGGTLSKAIAGLEVDLSAIAKGYACDRVSEFLFGRGFTNTLVEIGGEIRARGSKRDGPFKIGIEVPDEARRSTFRALSLKEEAVATSGDYRNYYEREGERISHTIDARSGYPIKHHLASVTVVHESAMWADGYATALNVLGPKAALDFANDRGLAVLLLVRESPGHFKPLTSRRFDERFGTQ